MYSGMIRSLFFLTWLLSHVACRALTADELQSFIDEAAEAEGGGEVVIPPGRHVLNHALVIQNAKKLRIAGLDAETTVLQLPPLAYGEVREMAGTGDRIIHLKQLRGLKPGMKLRVEKHGDVVLEIKAAGDKQIELTKPLTFPCPAGTVLRDADTPNLFEIRGACESIRIDKLTLDGGKAANDPVMQAGDQSCGILAVSSYDETKGPADARIKGLQIERCFFQNFHGRGIALYACTESGIEKCTFRDSEDAAIVFDHFTTGSHARHNHIARCRLGIELRDTAGCLVDQNAFLVCRTGIRVWRTLGVAGFNESNVIRSNDFDQTVGNAVQIDGGTAKNSLVGNWIDQTGMNGVVLAGQGHMLKDNRVTESGQKDILIVDGEHEIDTP